MFANFNSFLFPQAPSPTSPTQAQVEVVFQEEQSVEVDGSVVTLPIGTPTKISTALKCTPKKTTPKKTNEEELWSGGEGEVGPMGRTDAGQIWTTGGEEENLMDQDYPPVAITPMAAEEDDDGGEMGEGEEQLEEMGEGEDDEEQLEETSTVEAGDGEDEDEEEMDEKLFNPKRDMFKVGFNKNFSKSTPNVLFFGPRQDPPYRWSTKLHNTFWKLVDKEGSEDTMIVWVRSAINAKISLVAKQVASFIRIEQKVTGLPLDLGVLHVSLGGDNVKQSCLWDHPGGSTFLLHEDELTGDLKEHRGHLWQCKSCGLSKAQRSDVMQNKKRKCRHALFYFEGCHSGNSMGKGNTGRELRPAFCPKGHFGQDEPAPVPTSNSCPSPTAAQPPAAASTCSPPPRKKQRSQGKPDKTPAAPSPQQAPSQGAAAANSLVDWMTWSDNEQGEATEQQQGEVTEQQQGEVTEQQQLQQQV